MEIIVHTPSGKEVKITIADRYDDYPQLNCEIPDANVKTRGYQVLKLKTPKLGATHYIDSHKPIGLDTANAKLVEEAIGVWREAKRQSPEGQAKALRVERENLQAEIAGWWDAMDEAKEKAFDTDTGAGWEKVKEYEAKAEAVKLQLRAFDMAHPEIIAQIKADKEAATARFLAND